MSKAEIINLLTHWFAFFCLGFLCFLASYFIVRPSDKALMEIGTQGITIGMFIAIGLLFGYLFVCLWRGI